ncbi:MAG TPA: recombinase family protein [Methylomirabilota bacterium]|nr:recombinase family protein [Methylomirabilota bacterium]
MRRKVGSRVRSVESANALPVCWDDTTTPAGHLLFHVLVAISEFERDLIRDRVLAGLRRARVQGRRLGRPRVPIDRGRAAMLLEQHSYRQVAKILGVSLGTLARAVPETPGRAARASARKAAS